MVKHTLEIKVQVCNRCGHEWIPRTTLSKLKSGDYPDPAMCPGCKSPYWNKERKNKVAKKNICIVI